MAGTGNTFSTSWDGTDSEGYRVPDGDYQVIGTATYFASNGDSYTSSATHTVTVSGGSISVKILNTEVGSNDPESANLYSDTTADVDTVGHGTSGSRSDSATIRYEITGARVEDVARRRVRLHIYKGDTKNKVKTINLGSTVGTRLSAYWDGTNDSNQFSYGEHFAIITLDLDFDSLPEPEAQEWEHSYRSNSHVITVYSFPVADAGGHQFFDWGDSIPKYTSPIVTFDGSQSHDPDDGDSGKGINSYSWKFGDGNWAPQEIAKHLYQAPGTYTVELTVKDNDDPQRDHTDETKVTNVWLEDQTVFDGNPVQFDVKGDTGAIAWNWSYFYAAGAGNNPDLPFSDNREAKPTVSNARWFALPDDRCTAERRCTYWVNCEVTFPHGSIFVGADLHVTFPSPRGNVEIVYGNRTEYNHDEVNNRYEYTGIGTITRGTTPLEEAVNLPPTSQFYKSVLEHERVHIEQLTTGVGRNLFSLNELASYLADRQPSNPNNTNIPDSERLHAESKSELDAKVSAAIDKYYADAVEDFVMTDLHREMERAALAESEKHRNYFHNCGRY